jgi:thiol:disulfide interchange protein DsbD
MKFLYLLIFMCLSVFAFPSKFLMPDEAFKPSAKLNNKMQIEASVKIAKDMYLYVDALKLELLSKNGISIKDIKKPQGVKHHDDMVYLKSPSFLISLKKDTSDIEGIKKIKLKISYQGCSERGLCYEPMSKIYSFDIDTSRLNNSKIQTKIVEEKSQSDAIADTIKSGSIGVILLTFLGFGLLLALTPCVFPMIPIISGVIISQGKNITTKKAFLLSVVYVLSMAVAYTIAGVLAGLFGSNLQAALQTPWVIYSFSAIFVALAMSMFGFYELKLPDALVTKVSVINSNKTGYIGVAIMGFLSALIVGPCVAAPLAGALVYIGQTGDALLGGMALFSMSIGMGLPLIVVGVSAGRFMPKPGAWMSMVSVVFGVMMLGVAIWMLDRVVDAYVSMVLYAVVGIGFSIYLGVFEKQVHIFKKSVAVVIFIYSTALFIGALGGSTSISKPLSFFKQNIYASSIEKQSDELKFEVVESISELDKILKKNKGKKIFLDFSASWCTSCKELDEITFKDERVKSKLSKFVLIRADLSKNSDENKKLSAKYGVFGPPVIMFFDENLKVLKSKTIVGFVEPERLLDILKD